MAKELGRYVGSEIAQQIGVVRLDDDMTSGTRGMIQGTQALAKVAEQTLAYEERKYIDDFQIRQREKYAEISAKHQLNPEGFRKEWQAHSEGTLGSVPTVFARTAKTVLGDYGSRGYAGIVEHQANTARANAKASWNTNSVQIGELYLAAVRRKDAAEVDRLRRDYELHLEEGRRLQFLDEKGMIQEKERLSSLGAAAIAADDIEAAWRKGGMPAARKKMKEFESDPAYAAARDRPTTFQALKTEAWTRVRELEADAARGRAAATEGLETHISRASEGLPLDYDALRKYQTVLNPQSRAGKIVATLLEKAPVIEAFRGASLQDQAAELANLNRQIEDPKAPNLESLTAQRDVLQRIHARASKAYETDPFTYTNRIRAKQDVGEIDFARPDQGELAKRRQIVSAFPEAALPFSREEMGRFASTWNAASPADKGRIAASLNDGLGGQLAARVLGRLSKDGNVDRASVYAAGVSGTNPALARDIYAGLEVLKTEKKAAPAKEEDFQRTFNEYAGPAYKHSTEARDGAYEASRALMALWAKNNGKLGEEVPQDQMKENIKRVVGNTVRYNGSTLLPPRPDMNQRDFDAMIGRVKDQDAPKLKALDGSEVSITKALRAGTLESYGQGKYVIRFGESFYLPDPKNPGKPYVLDEEFFERARTREQYEDFGDTISGNPDSRTKPGDPRTVPDPAVEQMKRRK